MRKETQNGGGRYQVTAKELCYVAIATALLAVCSWICVPIGNIPVTLQTLALFLIVGLLGTKRASFAVLAYLALGLFGVPVFALFTGGFGKLFTPTGGFLIGFLVATPIMGFLYKDKLWQKGVALLLGLVVYNIFAVVWFCFLYTGFSAGGVWTAILTCVLPYLTFDVIKIMLSLFLAEQLKSKIKL